MFRNNPYTRYKKKQKEKKENEEREEMKKKEEQQKKVKPERKVLENYFDNTILPKILDSYNPPVDPKTGEPMKDWKVHDHNEKLLKDSLDDEKVKKIVSNIYDRFVSFENNKGKLLIEIDIKLYEKMEEILSRRGSGFDVSAMMWSFIRFCEAVQRDEEGKNPFVHIEGYGEWEGGKFMPRITYTGEEVNDYTHLDYLLMYLILEHSNKKEMDKYKGGKKRSRKSRRKKRRRTRKKKGSGTYQEELKEMMVKPDWDVELYNKINNGGDFYDAYFMTYHPRSKGYFSSGNIDVGDPCEYQTWVKDKCVLGSYCEDKECKKPTEENDEKLEEMIEKNYDKDLEKLKLLMLMHPKCDSFCNPMDKDANPYCNTDINYSCIKDKNYEWAKSKHSNLKKKMEKVEKYLSNTHEEQDTDEEQGGGRRRKRRTRRKRKSRKKFKKSRRRRRR